MADAKQTIDLIFNGVDKTGAATQAALNNTKKFAGNIQGATQPIADFTASAVKFEAALLAAGVTVTAFAVKIAGDFDTAFREISTLIDQPIEDLDRFKESILSYASTSTAPLEEVTQSIYNAISAGVDYSDSIEAVALAEKLSVAGKATLSESLTVLVSSLNAYGVGMEQAESFSDALFQTVKLGQTTLPELANSLASVTGLAATAGVDFQELLAAVATLTSTGTPTSQAVTQIQGALSAILKPTSQASALAKQLGIDFSVSRLQAVGFSGILDDVKGATGGSAEQMAVLFGRVEALNGVLTLTGLGADKFASNLISLANSGGSVELAFNTMVQSVDASVQKIQNSLNILFINIGAPLLDEFDGVADAIAAIFKSLGESAASDAGIGELVAFIESQFEGLEATLQEVARNLPEALKLADFSGFQAGVGAVTDAVASLFEDVDLSSAQGLADAITVVGNGFNALSQFTGGVIKSFDPLFDQITKVAGGFKEIDAEFFKGLGTIGGTATQINLLSGALVQAIPVIQAMVAAVGVKQGVGLAASFAAAAGALQGQTGLLALLGKTGLAGAALGAGAGVGVLLNKITEVATGQSASTWLVDLVSEVTGLQDKFDGLTDTVDVSGVALRSGAVSVNDFGNALDNLDGDTGYITELPDLVLDTAVAMDQAKAATQDFAQVVDQISIDEKLALIDGRTQITVAGIEAGAVTMKAAFESVSTSIVNTGETLTDLYGLLGDDNISKFDKLDLSKEIDRESERRDKLIAEQIAQSAAQRRLAEQQSKRLNEGGALINVSGDGLQPHLEAIMYSLFEAIQVRVNADGYELLLGAGP